MSDHQSALTMPPLVATSSTGTPSSSARFPIMLKTAKPPIKEKALFAIHTIIPALKTSSLLETKLEYVIAVPNPGLNEKRICPNAVAQVEILLSSEPSNFPL